MCELDFRVANLDFENSAAIFGIMNAVYQIAFPSSTDQYLYVPSSMTYFHYINHLFRNDWILFWATYAFPPLDESSNLHMALTN